MDKSSKVKKYLLIILGSLSLVLGSIGLFVPVMPTTPFLLLALFCYLRSSEKLYQWLIGHRMFGNYLNNYVNYKAISKNAKIGTLVFLWTALIVSSILIDLWYVRLFLLAVGISVSIHVLKLKTLENIELNKSDSKINK